MDAVGFTARWVAAARAAESARPDRLFSDPLAERLAGPDAMALLARMDGPGNPYLAVRTRFLDDLLLAATCTLSQVVVLAAGMDARAFRLAWPAGTVLFEVERAQVLDVKEPLVAGSAPTCDRRVVVADLAGPWEDALIASGFRRDVPAVFLVEGLLVYLPAEAVHTLLDCVAALAAPGSRLATDVAGTSLLTSPYTAEYLARLATLGAPWIFGTDEPEALLAAHGFRATAVEPGVVSATYGRTWPHPVVPRAVPGVPRTYLVTAERVDAGHG